MVIVPVDVVGIVLNSSDLNLTDLTDLTISWIFWGLFSIPTVLITIAVLAWGRSTARRVAAAATAVIVLGVQRLLTMPPVFAQLTAESGVHASIRWMTITLWIVGMVLSWGIARRRTPFAWVGLVPTVLLIALAIWISDIDWALEPWLINILTTAAIDLAIVISILAMRACDRIGMSMRQPARAITPQGYVPQQFPGTPLPNQPAAAPLPSPGTAPVAQPYGHQPQHHEDDQPGPDPR
ncbi:hypothetical protein GOEFS_075_00480 [Gordonia effusa NBRC 100432]|uniref:Uncharacterized protein n=1 Tax=Gordonia effusa NBRC 100432 TaxID=1077974 RepID=H0R222_9ACTN|nr:hypothetical protein GOEFS_075_00480 [Gordonia effusa NBRC 100432]